MARVNVSVPDPMKSDMDALNDAVNWSRVAQQAFADAIASRTIPKDITMENVIERVRRSKTQFEQQERGCGLKEGTEFAMKEADYQDMRIIGELSPNDTTLESLVAVFKAFVDPSADHERFFGDVQARSISDERVAGFVKGVQSIWDEIKDKV